ncbi:hypothetical protein J7L09_00485 [bacterium]|nr:hypothetical protein [bacterium]
MDFKIIKKILQKEKAKIFIIEDGKPTMVISSFQEYQDEVLKEKGNPERGVMSGGNPIQLPEKSPQVENLLPQNEEEQEQEKELTLDDLPL